MRYRTRHLYLLKLILIGIVAALPVRAQESVDPRAAAALIQAWYDEISADYRLLEYYRGSETSSQAIELRRSDRFYPIHRRTMLDSRNAARDSTRVDGAAFSKLQRGMEKFRAEHQKVVALLNKLQDAERRGTSSADRDRIVAQIKPYYRMRLFSMLKPEGTPAALPPELPKGNVIEAGKVWVNKLNKEQEAAARKADCSCQSVRLARVTAYTFTGTGLDRSTKTYYDIRDKTNPPQTGPLMLPVITQRRSVRQLNLPSTERICFYFSFPRELAFLRQAGRPHPCDTHVVVKFPHTRSASGYYNLGLALYSVTGTGGSMYSDSVFSAATEGRKVIRNQICLIVVQQGEKIGPAGKTGNIRWSVRRAHWLKGGAAVQQCGTIGFTMK